MITDPASPQFQHASPQFQHASPHLGRRALLTAGLLTGAGTLVAGCTSDASPAAAPADPTFDPKDWNSVRAQFTLNPDLAHFAAYVFAAHPAPVRQAIERHRDELDTDTMGYLHASDREHQVREAAGAYLGADAGDIALTDSTTMGIGLLCGGVKLQPGQEIVSTEHDFYSTNEALRLLTERTGTVVRRVRLYDDPAAATETDIVARLQAGIGPRTRVAVVTWVHSGTGVRLPIEAIGEMLASANANRNPADRVLLWVDGVHGLGAIDADLKDLGCDFLTSGTHKWLFGPRGTGVLWGRAWDTVAPLIPAFATADGPGLTATPGGYHSFEHRWAAKEVFEFLGAIGRDRIAARIREQAARLKDGLAGIASVRLITPKDPNLSAGIVCCTIDGVDPHDAVQTLRDKHKIVATVTPYAERYLRLGPGIVTTPEQVDQVVGAVATLA